MVIWYFGKEVVEGKEVVGWIILFGGSWMVRKVIVIVDLLVNLYFEFDMLVNVNFGYKGIIE